MFGFDFCLLSQTALNAHSSSKQICVALYGRTPGVSMVLYCFYPVIDNLGRLMQSKSICLKNKKKKWRTPQDSFFDILKG